MRISELSRRTGVPVATIKYYLRDGLLPAGRPTAATQAEYDEEHVARLRLVRALVDVGRLPLASVRAVLQAIDAEPANLSQAVATAHGALPPAPRKDVEPTHATAVMEALGWTVAPETPALRQLELALDAVAQVGLPMSAETLQVYGAAALDIARQDLSALPTGSPAETLTVVVAGTLLYEPILLALRRLAQQHLYAARLPT